MQIKISMQDLRQWVATDMYWSWCAQIRRRILRTRLEVFYMLGHTISSTRPSGKSLKIGLQAGAKCFHQHSPDIGTSTMVYILCPHIVTWIGRDDYYFVVNRNMSRMLLER